MYDSVFGFLAGSVAASASVYYYVLGEYRLANEMLSDDIAVCLSSCISAASLGELLCSFLSTCIGLGANHMTVGLLDI